MNLENKVVIVTGAAQGLGLACAQELAAHGARVVLSDIQQDAVHEAAQAISTQTGNEAIGMKCDVTQQQDVVELIGQTASKFGAIDVLINNAGILSPGTILDLKPEDFDGLLSVNLRGAFLVGQQVARNMVETGTQGSIVNMASVNSVVAIPNQLAYAVSKGGVQQLTRAMAMGLAEHNIRVNAIGPGSIMTGVLKKIVTDKAAQNMTLSRIPLRRYGKPDEVAKAAVFLASDYASYITGETIYVDGGRLALNYVVPVEDEAEHWA